MRIPEYLSPSAISLYDQDKTAYFMRYVADNKPARDPQTQPMAVGSAFDAYVKNYLYEKLFGTKDGKYELRTLFEAQVEEGQRSWAWDNGRYVFEQYKQSGVLFDLMAMIQDSPGEPRFEFEIKGAVAGYREGIEGQFGEVVLLGKPDVHFITKEGMPCILDFKVNGYCSKYPKSPAPHYLRLRSAGGTNHGRHARCSCVKYNDVMINIAAGLEEVDESWARQLAIYGWLCGEPIGSQFATIIHQLVCNPNPGGLPRIKVAELHHFIGAKFQQEVFDMACSLWEIVHSDHYFRDMSQSESLARCNLLNSPIDKGSPMGSWISAVAR